MTTEQKIEALTKEFNEKIEALKKEVSPVKFEVGKWYFCTASYGDFIIRFVERKGDFLHGPWIMITDDISCWDEHAHASITSSLRLATKEEIESSLIKEAEKRGFKGGVKIRSISDIYKGEIISNKDNDIKNPYNFSYHEYSDTLSYGYVTAYAKGQWAEIIKEQPIMIGSYEVKFNSDSVTVGCQTVSKETIKKILEKLDEE